MMKPFRPLFDNPYDYTLKIIIDEEMERRLAKENIRERYKTDNDAVIRSHEIAKEVTLLFIEKLKLIRQVLVTISYYNNELDVFIQLGNIDDISFTYYHTYKYMDIYNELIDYTNMLYNVTLKQCIDSDIICKEKALTQSCIAASKKISIKYKFPICTFYSGGPMPMAGTQYADDAVEMFRIYNIDILKLIQEVSDNDKQEETEGNRQEEEKAKTS